MGEAACKLKIILDSGSAIGYAQGLQATAAALSDEQAAQLDNEAGYAIIGEIISAEHALAMAHDRLLDAIGYHGPRPK